MRFIAELASASVYSWMTVTPHRLLRKLAASSGIINLNVYAWPRVMHGAFSNICCDDLQLSRCVISATGISGEPVTASPLTQPASTHAGGQATDLERVPAVLPVQVEAQRTAGPAWATGRPYHDLLAVQPAGCSVSVIGPHRL